MYKDEIYIQNEGGNDTEVRQFTDWGMEVIEMKLPLIAGLKKPSKNSWVDEHGDEEYIPDELMLKATEISFKLGCRGLDCNSASKRIREFLSWLLKGGLKKILIPHMQYGRKGVRLSNYSQDVEVWNRPILVGGVDRIEHILVFTIKMKVNDPVTEIIIQNNNGQINLVEKS